VEKTVVKDARDMDIMLDAIRKEWSRKNKGKRKKRKKKTECDESV